MRKLVIATGAALAVAVIAGVFLSPEKFPVDRQRYEAQWACMQSKSCASFAGLFGG
jgi:hypothetical protein